MRSGARIVALATCWLLALTAGAAASEVCEAPPATGPVSLMILKSPGRVQSLAKSLARGVPVVARSESTVVFQDGRVMTSDVEAAGRELNRLGWSRRPIQVVASFPARQGRATRRRG